MTSLPPFGDICVVRFSGAKFGDEWELAEAKLPTFAACIGRPCLVAHEDHQGEWEVSAGETDQNLRPVKEALPALQWYQITLSSGGISTDFPQTFAGSGSRSSNL